MKGGYYGSFSLDVHAPQSNKRVGPVRNESFFFSSGGELDVDVVSELWPLGVFCWQLRSSARKLILIIVT